VRTAFSALASGAAAIAVNALATADATLGSEISADTSHEFTVSARCADATLRVGASPATSKTMGADASVFVVSSTIISFVYVVDILDYIFQSNQEKK
jgi:hypothetical protein